VAGERRAHRMLRQGTTSTLGRGGRRQQEMAEPQLSIAHLKHLRTSQASNHLFDIPLEGLSNDPSRTTGYGNLRRILNRYIRKTTNFEVQNIHQFWAFIIVSLKSISPLAKLHNESSSFHSLLFLIHPILSTCNLNSLTGMHNPLFTLCIWKLKTLWRFQETTIVRDRPSTGPPMQAMQAIQAMSAVCGNDRQSRHLLPRSDINVLPNIRAWPN